MSETCVATEDLRALLDAAIGSLDFGSGFLDDEEVAAMRRIAVALGVDPMNATPSMFASKYPHKFHRYVVRPPGREPYASEHCSRCSKLETDPIHAAA